MEEAILGNLAVKPTVYRVPVTTLDTQGSSGCQEKRKTKEKNNRKSSHSAHDCRLLLKSLHGADSVNSTIHSYFIERKN